VDGTCWTNLFAMDPWMQGISFRNGYSSVTWENYLPYNAGVDIAYGLLAKGKLTIAPEGSRMAGLVDIGTDATLRAEYKITGAPLNSIYLSIHVDHKDNLVLLQNFKNQTFQRFLASQIAPLGHMFPSPSFTPLEGHIYLINITDTQDHKFHRIVKLLVNHIDDTHVMVRWDVLKDSEKKLTDSCFIKKNAPTDDGDGSGQHGGHAKTAKWVRGSLIALFVLVGLLLISVIAMVVMFPSRRAQYERI